MITIADLGWTNVDAQEYVNKTKIRWSFPTVAYSSSSFTPILLARPYWTPFRVFVRRKRH